MGIPALIVGRVVSGAGGGRIRLKEATMRLDSFEVGCYLASQTSSIRQPLKMLLTIIFSPLTRGCQQVAAR